MNIAVIPARGGSKRIPRKNIKEFGGRPMIAYAIRAALDAGLFEHVIVSTEDEEIARISESIGAEVPFLRPAALADDQTPTVPVVRSVIESCAALGWNVRDVCCVYPCVPFLEPDDLISAHRLLSSSGASYVFTVSEFPASPQRALRINEAGEVEPFLPEFQLVRTQDLEPLYFDAGQFYWGAAAAWLDGRKIHSHGVAFVVPGWRAVDIDTPEDWERAARLYEALGPKSR
ncbi:N-acylneuraminate cytidylyltransferase [Paraburkholderia sp. BL8N3]|nr:pseudaminic acid cytidylyltransferase [Paraburkholderia sp. BL8N3]TCK42746.1 N-acylneuraminate cytidylyltransferase [Paraburkholderia sp. BL8N3]